MANHERPDDPQMRAHQGVNTGPGGPGGAGGEARPADLQAAADRERREDGARGGSAERSGEGRAGDARSGKESRATRGPDAPEYQARPAGQSGVGAQDDPPSSGDQPQGDGNYVAGGDSDIPLRNG